MSAHLARVAAVLLVAQSPFDGTGLSARASRSRCADVELLGERCGTGSSSSSSSSSSRRRRIVIAPRVGLSFCDDVAGFGAIFHVGKDGPAGGTRRGGSTAARSAITFRTRSGRSADAARRARSCRFVSSRGACDYVDLRAGRLHARRAAWDCREEEEDKAIVKDRWREGSRRDRRSVTLRRNHGAESVVVSLGEAVEERTGEEEVINPAGEAVENDKSASSGCRSRAGDPVLIVPGFLADAYEFVPLAEYLRSLGFNALVAPIRWYHWVPTLGGRSIRPILDRMDATITYALKLKQGGESLCASGTGKLSHGEGENLSEDDREEIAGDQGPSRNDLVANEALPSYTFADFILELRDPREGSQALRRQSLASTPTHVSKSLESGNGNGNGNGGTWSNDGNLQEQGDERRVVMVAHSAAGWIARILMGSRAPYDGKIYGLARRIKVLLTLGTPHFCTDKLTKRNLDFVNVNYPGTTEESEGVEYVCVAGKAKVGVTKFGGLLQDVAYQSYTLCCGRGDVWGDGITPIECALGVAGAEHLLVDGVQHSPAAAKKGGKWYGSPGVVEQWVSYIDAFREKSEGGQRDSKSAGILKASSAEKG